MINTREIAAEYRLQHWAQIVQEQKQSGLSIKEFCETAGFQPNRYFYWQRKLREAACNGLPVAVEPKQEIVPTGWAAIEPAETTEVEASALPIEIGNCRIIVDSDTDIELLAKVCSMLVSLC